MKYAKEDLLKSILFTSGKEIKICSLTLKTSFFRDKRFLPFLTRFINKYLYKIPTLGIGGFYDRYSNSFSLYSSHQDKKAYEGFKNGSLFINLGSGSFSHPKWKNFDFPGVSSFYKCLQGKKNIDFFPIDLNQKDLKLPFKNKTVSLIYCSHTLEHLSQDAIKRVLKECKRVLIKGGILRVVLPNTKNDFERAKLIFDQNISSHGNLKEDILLSSAKLMYSSINYLDKENILKKIIDSDCSAEIFSKSIKNESKIQKINEFESNHPERHITYIDHNILKEFSREIGFSLYLPLLKNHSVARPFLNDKVFDTTENHYAIFGEFFS